MEQADLAAERQGHWGRLFRTCGFACVVAQANALQQVHGGAVAQCTSADRSVVESISLSPPEIATLR